jgi:hypothetical protein
MDMRRKYEYEFNADLLSLVQYFGDDSVTENLEELTIAVNLVYYSTYQCIDGDYQLHDMDRC